MSAVAPAPAPPVDPKTLTRSRERVRDAGEVYTRFREVDAMLDLLPKDLDIEHATFLEPSCGNGQFLVAIVERKVRSIMLDASDEGDFLMRFIRSLSTISAIEILRDSRDECVRRLMSHVRGWCVLATGEEPPVVWFVAARKVIELKIVLGNFLSGVTLNDLRINDDLTIIAVEHRTPPNAEYLAARDKRRARGPIFEDEAESAWPSPISRERYAESGVFFVDSLVPRAPAVGAV